nr:MULTISPECIES: FAD/NAD(P)-binding protein [unclassified Brevibacterium]
MVFVGGGPKTTGLLLALAAAARRAAPDPGGPAPAGFRPGAGIPPRLDIEVIDPYPVGGGRIWRSNQDGVLWMNSLAADITVFSDRPGAVQGPPLDQWIVEHLDPSEHVPGDGFAPRHVQGGYLAWAFDRARAALPAGWRVRVHRGWVTAAAALDGGYLLRVHPADARADYDLRAQLLVLAQGYIEVDPDEQAAALLDFTAGTDLTYIPPGYTADLDLSVLPAGEDVIVRGFGLAFIDAMMMLTEGRGGRFVRRGAAGDAAAEAAGDAAGQRQGGGRIDYVPSGSEPVLWVGSRRGVPLLPKLGYAEPELSIGPARYITADALRSLRSAVPAESLVDGVLGLFDAEMAAAHYVWLARDERRAAGGPGAYLELIDAWASALVTGSDPAGVKAAVRAFATAHVPDPADLYDVATLDRPLHGATAQAPSRSAEPSTGDGAARPQTDRLEDLEARVATLIRGRLDRAADPHFAQDAALFTGLVSAYFTLREFIAQGFFDPEQTARIDTVLHGFFSYIASGPPPERLENLLALHRAGLLRFLGPDLHVEAVAARPGADPGGSAGSCPRHFAASSPAHDAVVTARHLLDARLAPVVAPRARDGLLRGLIADGELSFAGAGKFATDPAGRALDAEGRPQRSLFMVGPAVSGSTAEAFARPGTDARVFRANEALADHLLARLRAESADRLSRIPLHER